MNKTLLAYRRTAILFVVILVFSGRLSSAAVTFHQRVDDPLPLGTPSLFLPADKSTMLSVEYLQLEWNFVSGSGGEVIYYDLYFGDSPTPALYRENISDGWVSDDGLEFALKEEYNNSSYLFYLNIITSLQYQTTYYWKVVAKNSQGESKSSETFSFTTIRQNTLPTPPVIISPLNNTTDIPKTVTLQWAASTDADGDPVTYDLYFGKNKANPQLQPSIQTGLTTNSYTIPYDLDDQETYYWKVHAIDGYNGYAVTSDGTSNTSKFTVSNYIADAPVTGVLLTPANSTPNATFLVNFSWEAATDKDNESLSYDVYADATPNPQTRIAANLTATSFSYRFNTYGKLYWKVVVKDASGLSDTSGVYSFTTWDKAPDFTIEMADVEGGTFNMGQSKVKIITDPYYVNLEDEWPEHEVQLDDYRMAKMEITNEQYVKFLNAIVNRTTIINSIKGHGNYGFYYRNVAYNGRDLCQTFDSTETGRPVGYEETYDSPIIWNGTRFSVDPKFTKHPVRFMYAYGAELFAEWAGNYRLPTEAEWEFAAMGGKLSEGYEYSGSNNYKEVAVQNIGGPIDGKKYTQPVGSLKPNELGIYDMTGNVEEICSDCYKADFYSKPEASGYNPLNKVCSGLERVIRGGNFTSPQAVYIRIKKRNYLGYSQITDKSGIRLAKSRENNEFSISGTVAGNNGVPIENVTLGGFSQEVRSNNNGLFSSTETSGWSGTITPQAEGYTFSPEKFEIKNLANNLANVNFTAIPVIPDYTITGNVLTGDGTPLQDVVIKLGTLTTSTNVIGEFSFIVAKGWEGSLVPEMNGYTFTPEKIDIASLQGNLPGNDFTAIPVIKYYAVSGTIADSDGIRLANIGIGGFSGNVATTSDGVFLSNEKEGWSGIITPISPNYTFDPASWSISNLQKDSTVRFTARLITSVSNPSLNKEYKLFPNPSNGIFEVQFPGNRAYIRIYDIVGNVIYNEIVNNRSKITLANKGVFIVNILTDNDLFIEKIVIE